MSAFYRLAGTEEPKLPLFPVMVGMTRVLDGAMTIDQFSTFLKNRDGETGVELTNAEKAEFGEYLAALGGMVTTRATELVGDGHAVGIATEIARAIVNAKMIHALLEVENGLHTEASFRAVFGLS